MCCSCSKAPAPEARGRVEINKLCFSSHITELLNRVFFVSEVGPKLIFSVAAFPDQNRLSFAKRDPLKAPRGLVPARLLVGQGGGSDIQQLNRARSSQRSTINGLIDK